MNRRPVWARVGMLAACVFFFPMAFAQQLLKPLEVNALPAAPPDQTIVYGSDPSQFAELRLPKGEGPFPVAVVIHGGCWMSFADLKNTAPLSDALRNAGLATWNIEYRRIGNAGGGWPGTFHDVATAVDHLQSIAGRFQLDLNRVIAIGHSGGGHLATWAAARQRLAKDSPLFVEHALRLQGVINLAGPADLQSLSAEHQQRVCGDVPIPKLLGGSPDEVPRRYHDGSPSELLPLGVPQILITGALDRLVPPALGEEYAARAHKSGDHAVMKVIDGAGHFEVIAPGSEAWSVVQADVLAMVQSRSD